MRQFDLLNVENVTFGYVPGVPAVRNVTMHVYEHEIVTILGSNAAGKTTVLKVIAGLLAPWEGGITYQGERISGLPAHELVSRGLVMVPSDRAIFGEQTVEENLLLGAYHQRRDRRRTSRSIADVMERYPDLAERRSEPALRLSGGQLRRLAFARAQVSRPRILLLDEPTLGLSPRAAQEVSESIIALRDTGVTILMVEKRPRSVMALSDRVYIMDQGRVVLSGPARDVLSDSRLAGYFLGDERPR